MTNRRDICTIVALIALAAMQAAPRSVAVASAQQETPRPSGDQEEKGRSPRNASYDIDVRLDHQQRKLRGRETLRWRNISSRPATELQFHLYWNAWRNRESTWMRERRFSPAYATPRDDAWGWIDVAAVRLRRPEGTYSDLTPQIRYLAPDDGNSADRTVMSVPSAVPIQPNETVEIQIEWTSQIPRPFARTGYIDDYYFIAHWFPKIGVLEETGWNTHQFHAVTEFYADYGVYDVGITVPTGFVVGASGRQSHRADNADGTTTHRYRGEDIHDFAWTASPHFIEERRTFEHAGLNRVEMRLLLQPEHRGQEARHFDATAGTLRWFGEWFGAYPYDHITIVDPAYQSGTGGMEYPTLLTAGTRWLAPIEITVPESVTIHETAHQWWHGVIGTNEFESAWMDEGMTMFGEPRVIEATDLPNRVGLRFFGGFVPWVVHDIRLRRETNGNRLPTFRLSPEAEVLATPSFHYWPATATPMIYDKTALWLHTLERHLGWPVVQRIMSTYFERWKFRHPKPEDFFAIANEVSGQDLTWFVDQVYRGSNAFDYAVQELTSERLDNGRYRTTVVAQRLGEATFPVDVVTTFDDGEQITERWEGIERRKLLVYDRAARASTAQVDPRRVLLLDVNYTNNSRTLQPRSDEASLKWALTWMVWLQDLMLTYAFFV